MIHVGRRVCDLKGSAQSGTGEHPRTIPHGDMAEEQQQAFRDNPLLKGLDVNTNWGGRATPR
jgi:hypothetical protein